MRHLPFVLIAVLCMLLMGCQSGNKPTAGSDGSAQQEPSHAQGEALFRSLCMRCHSVHLEKPLIGPGLYKVQERVPSVEWLRKFIRNSKDLIDAGDPYAVEVYNKNNKGYMDPFPQLTDAELDAIIGYIAAYELQATP